MGACCAGPNRDQAEVQKLADDLEAAEIEENAEQRKEAATAGTEGGVNNSEVVATGTVDDDAKDEEQPLKDDVQLNEDGNDDKLQQDEDPEIEDGNTVEGPDGDGAEQNVEEPGTEKDDEDPQPGDALNVEEAEREENGKNKGNLLAADQMALTNTESGMSAVSQVSEIEVPDSLMNDAMMDIESDSSDD